MTEHFQAHDDGRGPPTRSGAAASDELYCISLDLLHDLLLQWREVWAGVVEDIERLAPSEREALLCLPDDPQEGMLVLRQKFATSFHPDVPRFLVEKLGGAANTVDQLREEGRCVPSLAGRAVLEHRVHRLESVLGGVGAVLRTLGTAQVDDASDEGDRH